MSHVLVDAAGAVRTVTLDRPEKRNAMNQAMLDALYGVFTSEPAAGERVVVIRANGPSFCAGIDLAERRQRGTPTSESPVERVFHAMETYPLPVISVVQGAAIAGGCELALHSEFVVAAEDARFGMSLAQIGLAPTWFLCKKLMEVAGPVATREILLLGDPVPARWMHDHGLIARIAPAGELDASVSALVDRLCANAPLSLRAMKAMIIRQLDYRGGIDRKDTEALVRAARASADAREGMAARLERRPARFTGS